MKEEPEGEKIDFLSILVLAASAICPLTVFGVIVYYIVAGIIHESLWIGGAVFVGIIGFGCLYMGINNGRKLYFIVKAQPSLIRPILLAVIISAVALCLSFTLRR